MFQTRYIEQERTRNYPQAWRSAGYLHCATCFHRTVVTFSGSGPQFNMINFIAQINIVKIADLQAHNEPVDRSIFTIFASFL